MSTKKKKEVEVKAYDNTWTKIKPASPDDIAALESNLKVSLPENLKQLLLTCAGGYPDKDYYHSKEARNEVSLGYILPAKEDKKIGDVLTKYRDLHSIFNFPDEFIPFAMDNGAANPLCLNIKTGEVFYFLTDVPSDQLEKFSNSLEEFLEGLSDSPF